MRHEQEMWGDYLKQGVIRLVLSVVALECQTSSNLFHIVCNVYVKHERDFYVEDTY